MRGRSEKQRLIELAVFLGLGISQLIYSQLKKYGLIDKFSRYILNAWATKNTIPLILIAAVVTVLLGWALNLFKRKNQKVYGFTEIGMSLVVSANLVYYYIQEQITNLSAPNLLRIVVPFLTAVYFTQRGFNNYFDGRDKERVKKSA